MGSKRKRKPRNQKRRQPLSRAEKNLYKEARKLTRYINYAAFIVLAWILLIPVPYFVVIIAATPIPVMGFVLAARFPGIVEINSHEKSTKPNMLYAIMLPTIGLAARMGIDYDLASYGEVFIISGILAVLALAFAIYKVKELNVTSWTSGIVSIFLFLLFTVYFWAMVTFTNCYLDRSEPQVFHAGILSKYISEGSRSDTFYIEVDAWGGEKRPLSIKVSEDYYDAAAIGDQGMVTLREGTLNLPWYIVDL